MLDKSRKFVHQRRKSAKAILGKYGFPDDYRTVTVVGFISCSLNTKNQSCCSSCTKKQVLHLLSLDRLLKERTERCGLTFLPRTNKSRHSTRRTGLAWSYFFQDFKTRTWNHLNGYTHSGMQQIGRRFVRHEVVNNYTEEEIYQMTTTVTTIVLLTISFFLKRHGHLDSGNEIQVLLETYGPVADGGPAGENKQRVALRSLRKD